MTVDYLVDEFIGNVKPRTFEEQVDKKISLLYDLRLIRKGRKHHDGREQAIRQMLLNCKTETAMDNLMHDVVSGKCTLNDLLARKGYLQ